MMAIISLKIKNPEFKIFIASGFSDSINFRLISDNIISQNDHATSKKIAGPFN